MEEKGSNEMEVAEKENEGLEAKKKD